MNFLLTWIHWGLAALLYLQSAELSKAAPALGDGERKPNEVIKFLEVYERSFCRTIETLVDIFQEYPDEVEYIFKPSCVPLMRCAGCCGDEGLECVPVDVHNVTMEIMRIKPHQSQHIAHMSFLQHSKCDCRPKKDVKNKQEKQDYHEPCIGAVGAQLSPPRPGARLCVRSERFLLPWGEPFHSVCHLQSLCAHACHPEWLSALTAVV
ncbi:vascular endothelial growth factor A isoform X4 [Cuculus canorus]|uniref:vascular endothelial growth factor A isoform X4 n=1 Tax=Cuculus canorus TaxID=55661 RepID=UPI0023AADA73|nr:vascular endothelial growth factor A isoform X4 [Cuculus canorus]